MTLFGVYRVIEFPGVLKLSTIVKPLSVDIRPTLGEMTHFLPYFFKALTRLTRLQL